MKREKGNKRKTKRKLKNNNNNATVLEITTNVF